MFLEKAKAEERAKKRSPKVSLSHLLGPQEKDGKEVCSFLLSLVQIIFFTRLGGKPRFSHRLMKGRDLPSFSLYIIHRW